MAQKPSIPKGTRDFGPAEMVGRNYIFNTIKDVFRKFGYQCIETPSMENLGTLLGKYGEEGDKLLFRIQNSGEKAALAPEKGLRYDLTVPFARFVVQHQNEIAFPFKRYQIQPVWRADRPQKGRYREFYQCDVDVIGSKSLLNELELVQMVDEVFGRLGIRVCIKINNRKILAGLAEVSGQPERLIDITVAIDKIDKIGLDAVKKELLEKGLGPEAVALIEPVLTLTGTTDEKIARMRTLLAASETGCRGLDEIETLFGLIASAGISQPVELDLSLARGLNYYTGAIFEVKALDTPMGSISGGGRYDNLTGIFGMPGLSGVGISFGVDRIYDVLNALDLYPADSLQTSQLLFINFGERETAYCLPFVAKARAAGIRTEMFPDAAKMKKQMAYANAKQIPFVALAGENEMNAQKLTLKNMASGEQQLVTIEELINIISA
ncbi:MAG: histidine--tRNA ligase [Bacteroidales bacterium]|nr:histidine--tRNA ligase [Bacteroidales bacterium]